MNAASKRVTECPFTSQASVNALAMAKLLPFLRGLPVITTICFVVATLFLPEDPFFNYTYSTILMALYGTSMFTAARAASLPAR